MREWITKQQLSSWVEEYGENSYGYILVQFLDNEGNQDFVDITANLGRVMRSDKIGLVMIIDDPELLEGNEGGKV